MAMCIMATAKRVALDLHQLESYCFWLSASPFLSFSLFASLSLYLSFYVLTCSFILRSYRLNIVYVHISMYALLVDSFTKQQQYTDTHTNITQIKYNKIVRAVRLRGPKSGPTKATTSSNDEISVYLCIYYKNVHD